MNSLEAHRELIEAYLAGLPLAEELGELTEAMRYSLEGGGKRIRPLLCLPALDDDDVRRGRATSHVQFDEATAILNGDALLAQAFELTLSYPGPEVARELSRAAIGMIGGQFDDVRGADGDLARRHSLKTGRLFEAAVGCALAVTELPESQRAPWRGFASEFGVLYQVVDDVIDGDGLAAELGAEGAHELADEIEARALTRLDEIPGDTSLLDELLSGLSQRIT